MADMDSQPCSTSPRFVKLLINKFLCTKRKLDRFTVRCGTMQSFVVCTNWYVKGGGRLCHRCDSIEDKGGSEKKERKNHFAIFYF